jgi:molybdate transport system substrate-binding protein
MTDIRTDLDHSLRGRRRRMRLIRVDAAATALTVLCLAGCGSSSSAGSSSAAAASSGTVSGTVTVFAAASLTKSFGTLATQFERTHPGTKVTPVFGASSALALQINQGAPADVFASASPKNMLQVVSAGGASSPTTFARNVMEIAVPRDNPAAVAGVADLAKSGVKVALCQPQVPCGATAEKVLANAKVTVKPVTLEADVAATLRKVESGEVDAGVVYVTDVRAAGAKVTGIVIPAGVNASTEYPIAPLAKARNARAARAFVDYVLSADGRQVLAAAGFEQP